MFRILSIFVVIIPALVLSAQDAAGLHEFTDKKGAKILAELLGVSDDRRMMRIRREDGQEFETEIKVLSLDDQQFIKNWMKTAGSSAMTTDFRLELDLTKKSGRTTKLDGSSSSYTYEMQLFSYEITVRNLSRETLPASRIEYVIVWDDKLPLYEAADGDWTYSSVDEDADQLRKRSGTAEIPELAFNRDETVTTEEFEIDEMFLVGDPYRKDEQTGIIARIVSSDGRVLLEERVGSARINSIEWEAALELQEPRPRKRN